jgi:hypothetical protein
MNARKTLSKILALLAGEKAALAHAESRYKANRRAGFKAHNHQRRCEQLAKSMAKPHPKRSERLLDRARVLGARAHRDHARAQYWFAEVKKIAHRIHKLEWERGKVEREHVGKVEVMFDSVTLSEVPRNAPAVAGYTTGLYPTYPDVVKDFPKAHHLSIAISAVVKARCLDIETGDATPYQAPAWLERELGDKPAAKPVGYASVSAWPEIKRLIDRVGIARHQYLIWTAHYTNHPHVCGPHTCGELPFDADMTQWTSAALGKNLDESRLNATVFP